MEEWADARRGGDDFAALYRGNVAEVYRYSLACVDDPADAEDVTQATFLAAFQELRRESRPRRGESWVLDIARRICHVRSERSLTAVETTPLDELVGMPATDGTALPDGLVSGLHGVPPRERTALFLHDIRGLTCAEIGEELGLAEGTISRLLVRGRLNLRQQLATAMTCERARWVRTTPSARELKLGESRAAKEHLAHCPHCAASGVRSAGLFGPLLLALFPFGRAVRLLTSFVRRGPRSATDALAGSAGSGAVVAKVVALGASATVAGGLAWHAAAPHSSAQPLSAAVAVHGAAESHSKLAVAPLGAPLQRRRLHAVSLTSAAGSSHSATVASERDNPPTVAAAGSSSSVDASVSGAAPLQPRTKVDPATGQAPSAAVAGAGSAATVPSVTVPPATVPVTVEPAPIATSPGASGGTTSPTVAVVTASGGTGGSGKASAPGQLKKAEVTTGSPGSSAAGEQAKTNPSAANRAAALSRKLEASSAGNQSRGSQSRATGGPSNASGQGAAGANGNADATPAAQKPGAGPDGEHGASGKQNASGSEAASGQSSPGKSGEAGKKGATGAEAAGAIADPAAVGTASTDAATTTTDAATTIVTTDTTDAAAGGGDAASTQDGSGDTPGNSGNGQGNAAGQQGGSGNGPGEHGKPA